jgi:hypothetical protein
VSCVPNVASVSGLSFLACPLVISNVYFLGTQDTEQIHVRDNQRAIKNGQSRDTGNIGYTRHRTNTR